jgi:predicted amidohydrolase YtcJ
MHSAWVNDAVMNLFHFDDVLKMLQKGYVQRDTEGRLTGLLHEEALEVLLDPLLSVRPAGIFKEPESYFSDFYRHGITSVHTMEHFGNYNDYLTLYQHSAQRGLRLGIYIYNSDSDQVYERGLRHGNGGDWLRFLGIKIFVDGALGSQTAWLREPYENALHVGKKQVHGDELKRAIARAEGHSCAISVHALGDAAVEHLLEILDSFERPLRVPLRIEHAQLLDEELIRRIHAYRIPLSLNPSHIIDDKSIAEEHWGKRSRFAYPFHSMKVAGIPFAFASDAPVENIHPWKGIYAAVHRTGRDESEPWYPEESIRISDAIRAYTQNAALLSGWEEKKGQIVPGYLGDCFVCDRDVFEYDLKDWREIHSVLTVIGGRVVYNEMHSG